MEYSTAFETCTVPEVLEAVADSTTMTRSADDLRSRQFLHVGGLTMDTLTKATSWRGKMLALPVTDRELLGVFMCHAGQIISRERLAAILGISVETLDCHVQALREALRSAGSTYVPYMVEGLGYIFWMR